MAMQLRQLPCKRDAQVFPVSWEQFEAIEQSFEPIPGVKFRYLDGILEIKSEKSELLPNLPLDLFYRYVMYHDQYDAVREFRQTIRLRQ